MPVQDRPETINTFNQPDLYPGTQWKWGFTPSAEIWNGRLAMLGFLAATLVEIATGHGYLRFLGFLTGQDIAP